MHYYNYLIAEVLACFAFLFYAGMAFLAFHFLETGRFDIFQTAVSMIFSLMGIVVLGMAIESFDRMRREERSQQLER